MFGTLNRASIAVYQLGDGVSVRGLCIGAVVLDTFALIAIFIFFFIFYKDTNNILVVGFLPAVSVLLITKEAVIIKFMKCFNYASNSTVIARSSMVFLFVAAFVGLHAIHLLNPKQSSSSSRHRITQTVLTVILLIALVATVVINIYMLAVLQPSTNKDIGPSNINIGYFNQTEINAISNNTYSMDAFYNTRTLSNLYSLIYSNNKILDRVVCTYSSKSGRSCTYYYWHILLIEIACTGQNLVFYRDCANATSLTVKMLYLDEGPYPYYNCLVNKVAERCASNCTQLLSANYQLVLTQMFAGKIESAWRGFSNCNIQPKILLTYSSIISSCSSYANILKINWLLNSLLTIGIIYFYN